MRRPTEPLTQVVFLQDYLQLVFEDETLSIYNGATLSTFELLHSGAPGFADALVSLIGEHVVGIPSPLSLLFSGGATLRVLVGPEHAHGPEAFAFLGRDGSIVVEQNAV